MFTQACHINLSEKFAKERVKLTMELSGFPSAVCSCCKNLD